VTTFATDVRLGIELGIGCSPECNHFAGPLLSQLDSGKYDVCATMPLPLSREAWQDEHRTSRKRAWKAEHHGYFAARVNRDEFEDDVWAVNLSRPVRQGRPMTDSYKDRPMYARENASCALHGVHAYGVLDGHGTLVAYLWMYRAGDLALVSQVLGHAAHEDFGIMHLLFREALTAEGQIAPGVACYNRWDSGKPGLRQLKAWVGFEETRVEWLP
jgi:hypothetical protein